MEFISKELGAKSMPFGIFEELITKIYGDLISEDPYQPQEVHLALGNELSTMKVQWVTMQPLTHPVVEFIPTRYCEDFTYAQKVYAISYTYTVPKKWWPVFNGMIYEADMTNLDPSEKYCYRVGGFDTANSTQRYSSTFNFTAPPKPAADHTTRVAALADHGTFELLGFETINRMVALEKDLNLDFVFVAGDLSYAGLESDMKILNITSEDEFEHVWDLLGIQNERIAAKYPWMVGDGNHERFYNWTAFTNRYKMPSNPDLGSNGNFWYTFNYGNIQWVSISSEHPLDEGSPQMNFLRAALEAANANRATVPWIILSIHRPIYCSVDGSPSFAARLEPILLEFDVDLTITGHMHAYERIHPVANGKVTVWPDKLRESNSSHSLNTNKFGRTDVYYSKGKGPVHVMQGHAGGMQAERWISPTPEWSAFRMADGIVMPNLKGEDIYADYFYDLTDDSNQSLEEVENLPLFPRNLSLDLFNYNYSHTYGFGLITAYNATHLHYEAIPNVDGKRNHDEFWIVKEH